MQLPPDLELLETADGSPTLAERRADGYLEPMHHSRGAHGESAYIYGGALGLALECIRAPVIWSIGLGLGYNELITLVALGERPATIHSFESRAFLREQFAAWAAGADSSALGPTFDRVANAIGGGARAKAAAALVTGRLRLHGAFPAPVELVPRANVVYFDAYSNKMATDLWNEDALVNWFTDRLDPACVFASYAVTGTLKRALARLGFTRIKRRGFSYRKESTLAVRGLPGR